MICEYKETQPGDLQIAIFSDAHYYDAALGDTGYAFRKYLLEQGKMTGQSQAIIRSLMQTLKNCSATIILVTGDMTKDGEEQDHLQMAAFFAELEKAGKRVFVIPGNHDINNPNSNSYVAALDNDTWLLAMDACIDQYKDSVTTEGRFLPSTFQWIKDRLIEARTKNIRVLGMIHHGMLEHFWGQDENFPGFLLDNWRQISPELAALGLKVVFSGHFHAQDIVKDEVNGSFMFDVAGYLAHYHGDEVIDASTQAKVDQLFYLGGDEAKIADTIMNLFTDLPTPDQNVEIDLTTGTSTPLFPYCR